MPTPQGSLATSDAAAAQLLEAARQAQGDLTRLHDVSVSYDGDWLSGLVNRVQPVLVDDQFRKRSQERLLLKAEGQFLTAQTHIGSGGRKVVLRTRETVSVAYNGKESTDPETLASAALVADAYRLFLLGPAFLAERGAIVKAAPMVKIDGQTCDQFLAILKPGIGGDAEDRVLVAVDRDDRRVRRYRMTLEALDSTKGAVVDVIPGDYVRIEGVWWPTAFYEELIRPFPAAVHRWRLTGIDVNRGLNAAMFDKREGFSGPATRPAGAVHPSSPAAPVPTP
ncbi:hypothetical protein [Humisphaera borealis]|uniref:Uncharacterized protein n=1 Tax=Humisphaera borealis TaxID=2807512 RepID=A0A7M2WT89_9BACT|nr:hypothetical protein [Humisphaera borealis]QOV87820.1 hypothetical protein IPV69_16195 [Humisphaera borealis]